MIVDMLIPALDEELNIGLVLSRVPPDILRQIVVVDNGSTDATADVARRHGAVVVCEPERGYGAACLKGLAYMADDPPDVVVFLDGDGADDPNDLASVLAPVIGGQADLVIGSRTLGDAEAGALTPVQRFGNGLSCHLIRYLFGLRFTDLGPFRAVTWSGLERLQMADRNFGWTVEMQTKAARRGLRCEEVAVQYKRRHAGQSKVSGTIEGSIRAGVKILYTIGREALRRRS